MSDEELPFPWTVVDGDEGRFYYNEETGESQWERPALEDCASRHSQEDPGDPVPRPELVYQEVRPLGKEYVRLVVLESGVLNFVPDGALATLACAPRELFRIEAVGGAELIEGTGDEPPPEGCVFVDVACLEQGWKGLPEQVEQEGTLTALLAASLMEEAFISTLHSLRDTQARSSKAQTTTQETWNAAALCNRVRELFPEIYSPGEKITDRELEPSFALMCSQSSLLDVVPSEVLLANSASNVVVKVSFSPLEETALRVFSDLADEKHKHFTPIAKERSWVTIAEELQRVMGPRDEDLDRRFLIGSPHFLFKEVDRRWVVRLKNPPAEKGNRAVDSSRNPRRRSRTPMKNGSRSRRPRSRSRRYRSPRRRSPRPRSRGDRRGGTRVRDVGRDHWKDVRDEHRRRSPRGGPRPDDRRSRPPRHEESRDGHRRDPPRGEVRRGAREDRREDRARDRRDPRDRSPRRDEGRRRTERRSRSRGERRGVSRSANGEKEPPWQVNRGGVWKEPTSDEQPTNSQAPRPTRRPTVAAQEPPSDEQPSNPKARPTVKPSVAPSLAVPSSDKVPVPISAGASENSTSPVKFSGGVSGIRAVAKAKAVGPAPPPGPPPAWAQRKSTPTSSVATGKPSKPAGAPTLMKAGSKAKPLG